MLVHELTNSAKTGGGLRFGEGAWRHGPIGLPWLRSFSKHGVILPTIRSVVRRAIVFVARPVQLGESFVQKLGYRHVFQKKGRPGYSFVNVRQCTNKQTGRYLQYR